MDKTKEVLENLEVADMHVHVIDRSEVVSIESPVEYKFMNVPVSLFPLSTHYVLNGITVVHVGTPASIERFALSL